MPAKQLVSVRIDMDLWKRVRVKALESNRTAQAIVEEALMYLVCGPLAGDLREHRITYGDHQPIGLVKETSELTYEPEE